MLIRRGTWNYYNVLFAVFVLYSAYRSLMVFKRVLHHKETRSSGSACSQSEDYGFIPRYMQDFVMDIIDNDPFVMPTCESGKKKDNFVFLKVQRCATETLSAVFRRFALAHNKTVLLPLGAKSFLGWPHYIHEVMYKKSKDNKYNIILDQSVYNRTIMDKLVNKNAVYFANLREPFSRLKSALVAGGMKNCGLMSPSVEDVTTEFLTNMHQYDKTFQSPSNIIRNSTYCRCIKKGVSIAKNAMAFDLGFPTGFHIGSRDMTNNYDFVQSWLQDIHKQLDLIMIQERFDESMVFLKRYMCWSFKDILYKQVVYEGEKPNIQYDQVKVNDYRHWNNIDTLLFEMSAITFDKRVKSLGDDFADEVTEFKSQQDKVGKFCNEESELHDKLTIGESKWDGGYTVTSEDCDLIYDWHYVKDMLKRHFSKYHASNQEYDTEGWNLNAWC